MTFLKLAFSVIASPCVIDMPQDYLSPETACWVRLRMDDTLAHAKPEEDKAIGESGDIV